MTSLVSTLTAGALLALVIGLCLLWVARSVRIVPQARAGIVERLGRYHRTLYAGMNLVVPFLDRLRPLVDLREQMVGFPLQPVVTRDNLVAGVDMVVYLKVTDPKAATYEVTNYRAAVEQLTLTTLRNVISGMDLKEALASRDRINLQLRDVLEETSGRWGIRIARVGIKDIEPPQSFIDRMKEGPVSILSDEQARAIVTAGMSQDLPPQRRSFQGDGSATRSDNSAILKAWHETDDYASDRKLRRYLLIALSGVLVITACLTFVLVVYERASWHAWSTLLFTGLAIAACIVAYWSTAARNTRVSFADFRDNYQSDADSRNLQEHDLLPGRWLTDPDLQNLIILNREQINVYQDIATGDAKRAGRNSQVAMSFGFAILIAGAVVTVLTPSSTSKIVVGLLASLGSVLSGYIGRTFLRAQDQAMRQLNYYFRQPLVTSYMLAAERLTLKLSGTAQQSTLKDVIKNHLIAAGRAESLDLSLPMKPRRDSRRLSGTESMAEDEVAPDR
jgi:SPFH domain / Band 7 family